MLYDFAAVFSPELLSNASSDWPQTESFMNLFSYAEQVFALLQMLVIYVAVAVAYSFPNGAPLRRSQPLSVALLSQRLLHQWPSSDVKHRDPPRARCRISWTDVELCLPLQIQAFPLPAAVSVFTFAVMPVYAVPSARHPRPSPRPSSSLVPSAVVPGRPLPHSRPRYFSCPPLPFPKLHRSSAKDVNARVGVRGSLRFAFSALFEAKKRRHRPRDRT